MSLPSRFRLASSVVIETCTYEQPPRSNTFSRCKKCEEYKKRGLAGVVSSARSADGQGKSKKALKHPVFETNMLPIAIDSWDLERETYPEKKTVLSQSIANSNCYIKREKCKK